MLVAGRTFRPINASVLTDVMLPTPDARPSHTIRRKTQCQVTLFKRQLPWSSLSHECDEHGLRLRAQGAVPAGQRFAYRACITRVAGLCPGFRRGAQRDEPDQEAPCHRGDSGGHSAATAAAAVQGNQSPCTFGTQNPLHAAVPATRTVSATGDQPSRTLSRRNSSATQGDSGRHDDAKTDTGTGTGAFGQLFSVMPFNNNLVTMDLSGQQLLRLLEQQWESPQLPGGRIMSVSNGFSYTCDASLPEGAVAGTGRRIVPNSMRLHGEVIELD